MTNKSSINRRRKLLDNRLLELDQDIAAVYSDLSVANSQFEKNNCTRRINILDKERKGLLHLIERFEDGSYLPYDEIIQKQIEEILEEKILSSKNNSHKPPIIIRNFQDRLQESLRLKNYLSDKSINLIKIVGPVGVGKTALVCKVFDDLEKSALVDNKFPLNNNCNIYLDAKSQDFCLDKLVNSIINFYEKELLLILDSLWHSGSISLQEKVKYLIQYIKNRCFIIIDNFDFALNNDFEIFDSEIEEFINIVLTMQSNITLILVSRSNVITSPILMQNAKKIVINEGLPLQEAAEYFKKLDPDGEYGISYEKDENLYKIANLVHRNPRALEMIVTLMASRLDLTIEKLIQNKNLFLGEILKNLFEESFYCLNENEKLVVKCLSIFELPIEFSGIAFVVNQIKGFDVYEIVKGLIDKLLVSGNRKENKYILHQGFKEFVNERIPLEEKIFLCVLCGEYYKKITIDQKYWNSYLDIESLVFSIDYFINAFKYSRAQEELKQLSKFLMRWGKYSTILFLRLKLKGNLNNEINECENSLEIGILYGLLGDKEKSICLLNNVLDIVKKTNFHKLHSRVLSSIGLHYLAIHDFKKSIVFFDKALNLVKDINDESLLSDIYGLLANNYRRLGEKSISVRYQNKALDIDKKKNNLEGVARRLFDFGVASFFDGDLSKAKGYFEESLLISESIGLQNIIGYCVGNMANCYVVEGDFERALTYAERALSLNEDMGIKRSQARNLATLGDIYFQLNEFESALDYHLNAKKLALETKDSDGICIWSINSGIDYLVMGEKEKALSILKETLDLFQKIMLEGEISHKLTCYFLVLAEKIYKASNVKDKFEEYQITTSLENEILFQQLFESLSTNTIGVNFKRTIKKIESTTKMKL